MEIGGYPGEATKCMVCRDNEVASREHIVRCAMSRLELTAALDVNGTNSLDDILSGDITIKEGKVVETAEKIRVHNTEVFGT